MLYKNNLYTQRVSQELNQAKKKLKPKYDIDCDVII